MNFKSLVVIFFIGCCKMYSQDTIKFVNKQALAAKVDEVGTTDIHYHRFDNLGGPVFIAKKESILWIKYSNGQVDSFKVADKKVEVTASEDFKVYNPKTNLDPKKIVIYNRKLFFQQLPLGDKALLQLISSYPDQQKKTVLLKEYLNMKNYQRRQYLFGFGGVGLGVGLLYGGILMVANSNDSGLLLMVAAVPVAVAGQIISGISKSKRLKKKIEIASIYNQ